MSNESMEVTVRGIPLTFAVFNPRLRLWAERFEEVEPELLDLIDSLPKGVRFFDAGASIGNFSLYAAIRAEAEVVAVEPEAQNYGTLELNHFLNRASLSKPFKSFNVALSDTKGIGTIYTRQYGAGEHVKILDMSATRDTHEAFQPGHAQTVLKLPIDALIAEFGLDTPQVLKIDVDGSEESLIRGAQETLAASELRTVFIELEDSQRKLIDDALTGYGFRLEAKHPVVRLRGGFYDGLFNCVYHR